MLLAILIGILALLIYFKIVKPQKYWKEKGAACVKPWPIVGSMGSLVFNKKSYAELIQDIYNVFPEKRGIIKETIHTKEEKGIVRPDMIHLFMEAQKAYLRYDDKDLENLSFAVAEKREFGRTQQKRIEIADEDITSQAILFFQRLIDDIDTTLEGCNGNITYEALIAMKYLNRVVSETLRKWPAIRDYVIQPKLSGEQPIYVDANTSVWIPSYAIHRDPQYYPNPDKFDPERFSDENKNKTLYGLFIN
ncbi:hypothetical protein ILUMI_25615 [Ignelater luminosus]|uniref:Cytochrome P450 n=1 Tax=Ignelater luminosus TaxID=2038154 RepID=A0A8K0C856_IGNLU|nr:hypothetical protein ILUMI_25615 [Ignelater luminosus]